MSMFEIFIHSKHPRPSYLNTTSDSTFERRFLESIEMRLKVGRHNRLLPDEWVAQWCSLVHFWLHRLRHSVRPSDDQVGHRFNFILRHHLALGWVLGFAEVQRRWVLQVDGVVLRRRWNLLAHSWLIPHFGHGKFSFVLLRVSSPEPTSRGLSLGAPCLPPDGSTLRSYCAEVAAGDLGEGLRRGR